jgi:hypothetical protein
MTTTDAPDTDKLTLDKALEKYAAMHKFLADHFDKKGSRRLYLLSIISCMTGQIERFAFLSESTCVTAAQIVSGGGVDIILHVSNPVVDDVCRELPAYCHLLRRICAPNYGEITVSRLEELAKEARNYIGGNNMLVMKTKGGSYDDYVFKHEKDFNDVLERAYKKTKAAFPLAPPVASVCDMIFERKKFEKSTAISRHAQIWCPCDSAVIQDEIHALMKDAVSKATQASERTNRRRDRK